jgi:hypothetical protein
MGLVRTVLIFGAGYALGHPASRAKLTELTRRTEVAQLRQQAADTVSDSVEIGKKQLVKVTERATDKASTRTGDSDSTSRSAPSGRRRLPSFPRRGAARPTRAARVDADETTSIATPPPPSTSAAAPPGTDELADL